MTFLYFLLVSSVGMLRPIRNSLALDGLAETQFYKVYLVSAVVVLFVPLYNRVSDRVPWRYLIPAVALFFATNLLVFRLVYTEGSAAFGMIFYGWYDLFAAALITQFFIATQLFFNARNAKAAYPIVISGGSLGATLGGGITGFFVEAVGAPNLMLVAAGLIAGFGVALFLLWATDTPDAVEPRGVKRGLEKLKKHELRKLVSNRHVRLIAATVLAAILVKQLVDYQFNTVTHEVFQTRDAVAAFQGKLLAATQWLPMLVLFALRPALRRWGVAIAVFLLPVALLGANVAILAFWGLWTASAVKVSETALRYSAERTGREILYVPVPDDIKLKAKAYIDVAVEKGLGKALSAGVIFVLLMFLEYRQVAAAAIVLAVFWLAAVAAVRREYVRTLRDSIQGRFASVRGVFASLTDASTLPVIQRALTDGDTLQTAFALDLVDQSGPEDVRRLAPELNRLVDHSSPEVRERAINALGRARGSADPDRLRARLDDPSDGVREAAVRVLCAGDGERAARTAAELLGSADPRVRRATLACLARGEIRGDAAAEVVREHVRTQRQAAGPSSDQAEARLELALAASALDSGPEAAEVLEPLLADPDPRVASAAIRGTARHPNGTGDERIIAALGSPGTREAAVEVLAAQGEAALAPLLECLLDEGRDPTVRRTIPRVLARIPTQATVDGLVQAIAADETDQLLDYRGLKALNKLRARHPELRFDPEAVAEHIDRDVEAARRYATARAALASLDDPPIFGLLRQALDEAWAERREGVFRCLGLLHPPDDLYRCYMAVTSGGPRQRANALEWLETTTGRAQFLRLAPVLGESAAQPRALPQPAEVLAELERDSDVWIAACARRASRALRVAAGGVDGSRRARWREGADAGPPVTGRPGDAREPEENRGMDLIEKVFLLQQVDLLQGVKSGDLALLATIAEVVEADAGTVLMKESEPPQALYVVIRGAVELHGVGERIELRDGTPFGTWALIDDSPSVVSAKVAEASELLRITRSDFQDLLADNPELAMGLLQGLARRVRTLVA